MKAPQEDLDRLMEVMKSAFDPAYGEAWTRKQVEDALLVGNCHYCLIGGAGSRPGPGQEAAGFFLSRTSIDEEELLLLAVGPKFRRQGLGRILLDELARAAKSRGVRKLFLEMRRGNPAECLYRNFGFVPVGQRPNYYRNLSGKCIDAITFAMPL